MKLSSQRWAFGLLLLLVVFFNLCAGPNEAEETSQAFAQGRLQLDGRGLVAGVRAYGTSPGDIVRYAQYMNAALGRPYRSLYIRPLSAWQEEFRTGQRQDLDKSPLVAPKGQRLTPYKDYLVEYPPGFFLLALPPALVTSDLDLYFRLFSTVMGGLLFLAVLLLFGPSGVVAKDSDNEAVARRAFCVILALGAICVRRYDAAVAVLLSLLVCSLSRPLVAGILGGLLAAVKGVPALALLPVALYYSLQGPNVQRLRNLVALGLGASTGCLVPFALAYGVSGSALLSAFQYHGDRPLHLESTAGALSGLFSIALSLPLQTVFSHGSSNLDGPLVRPFLLGTTALVALSPFLVVGYLGRRFSAAKDDPVDLVHRGIVGILGLFMVTSKMFSPQYLIWLLPLGALLSKTRLHLVLLLSTCVLCQVIYPITYRWLEALSPFAFGLVLLRNGTLLAWTLLVLLGQKEPR